MNPGFLDALVWLRPLWFLALLPLPLLLGWLAWRRRQERQSLAAGVDAHLQPHVLVPLPGWDGSLLLLGTAWVLAVLALAGPAAGKAEAVSSRFAGVQVLVVELPSDPDPDFDRVRRKLLDLLQALPERQTALLAYAGEPFLVAPPSTDRETIALLARELEGGLLPVPGNRPDRALAMARQLVERSGGNGELIWITAGPGEAAPDPGALTGLGLAVLDLGPAPDPRLESLARASGRPHVRFDAVGDGDIRELTRSLAAGPRERGPAREAAGADLGYWLLLPLLALALPAFRPGLLLLALLPLAAALGLPPPALAESPDQAAWRQFQSGDLTAAARGFADPRWKAAALYRLGDYAGAAALLADRDDAESRYNLGNALARAGRLPEALQAYEAALAEKPEAPDYRHNRDLVRRLLQPPPPPPAGRPPAAAPPPPARQEQEAARLAEQWRRSVPDTPQSLLRRKVAQEHQRRQEGQVPSPW